MGRTTQIALLLSLVAVTGMHAAEGVPTTPDELWADFPNFDKKTPLDVEILKTWEEDGIVCHVVRYTVGVFKGHTVKMAGYYAYPKGGKDLPALVQINGGGQKGSLYGPRKWANYGYACFNPNNGAQPWDKEAKGLPNTDWGPLNPGIRKPDKRDGKGMLAPGEGTIDSVISPRNYFWYPRMLAVRRGLSFLQSRPEVDSEKLGIRGHSTGGVMTVYTSVDPRVKASVPSVGGCGFWREAIPYVLGNQRGTAGMDDAQAKLFKSAISCGAHWEFMKCPIFFLGATNDFNSPTENVVKALRAVKHTRKNWVLAPHYNHAFNASAGIADVMWFEAHLKGAFDFPAMPKAQLKLKAEDGVPVLQVQPDPASKQTIAAVDIYYSYERQPQVRFWAAAHAKKKGNLWVGRCPIFYADEPLFAFANVTYKVDYAVSGPAKTTVPELMVTSEYGSATPEELSAVGVKATEKPQRQIDDFSRGLHDWTGNWTKGKGWKIQTRKVSDPRWVGPKGGELVFEVNAPAKDGWIGASILRRFRGQNNGQFRYFAFAKLPKAGWNTVRLKPDDFQNIYGEKLDDWHKAMALSLGDAGSMAHSKEKMLPRAGKKAVKGIPTDVSSWDNYTQTTDDYAKDNIEKRSDADGRIRNLRWEGGKYVKRAKHWEKN